MALVLADRVNETTTTTGLGTLTLAGAVSGYQSFSAVGNANTTYYTIVSQTTSEWEVGIGTYTSAGTTLSRDTVLASSAGGTTKVTLSAGTKFVFCDYPAGKAVYLDSSGNLGIGTSSPAYKLVVSNAGAAGLEISPTGGIASGGFIQSYNRSTSAYFAHTNYATSWYWNNGGASSLMTLDTSGNLLVGTTTGINSGRISSYAASGFQAFTAQVANDVYSVFQGFNSASTATTVIDGTGFATFSAGVSAPIYYDKNNTAYYGDFAGNSVFSNVQNGVNYTSAGGGGRLVVGPGSPYSLRQEFGSDGTGWRYGIAKNVAGTVTDLFYVQDNGTASTTGDFRAPIFYDSNNTAYYVDPASTSVINALTVSAINNLNALVNVWHTSSEGQKRFYFGGSATTYYGTGNNYVWRNSSDLGIITSDGSGNLRVASGGDNFASYALHVGGTGYATSDFRAPIFYDSNNTAYYLDPASTSTLATLSTITTLANTGLAAYDNAYGNDPYGKASVTRDPTANYSYYGLTRAGQFGSGIGIDTSNNFWWGTTTAGYNGTRSTAYFYCSSTGDLYGTSSVRAPIFYDSNNTAYYVDPTSASNIFGMTMGSTLNMWAGSYDGLITFGSSAGWRCGIRQYDSSNAELRMYASNALGKIFFATGYDGASTTTLPTDGMMLYSNNVGIGNFSSGVPSYDLHVKGTGYADSDLRAPIFYDSNDTTYYIDPASTSNSALRMRGGALFGPNTTWGAYLSIGTNGNINTAYASVAATNGNLHMDAASGYDMYLNLYAGNNVYFGLGGVTIRGGFYSDASLRANLFYDFNNTGYYVDPASTSEINKMYYNSNMVSRNYGIGQVGLYDPTRFQAVFAMGESYILPANGTTTGNLYGIAWSHPNAGGAAANLASHGILILENGAYAGAWGGGSIRTTTDVRAPIFYDSADTQFYLNLNGYSQVNGAGSVNASAGVGFAIYSPSGGGGAIMAYHRAGQFAINLGLDSDNVIRWGGWSASSNRLQMDMSGNLTMAGNVTAYSDIRIKTDILVIENALEKVSKIRGVTFIRTDEGSSDARQAGVIAQEVELVLPEVVSEDASGIKNVAYGNMAGLFIEAIKELKAEIEELKSRIH